MESLSELQLKQNESVSVLRVRRNHRRLCSFSKAMLWCMAIIVLLLSSIVPTGYAIDVKWTPNPNDSTDGDGGGPLPLSNKQRQQLLQLEQAIVNSPDPQATLEQVASTNSMSSTELYNMLQRNHNDMEQSGTMTAGVAQKRTSTMITVVIWNAITAMIGLLWQCIRRNPKLTTLLGVFIFSTIYISTVIIPQSGFILNQHTSRNILTKGPTSLFNPPTTYIQQLLLDRHNELFRMIQTKSSYNDEEKEVGEDSSIIEPTSSSRDLWKFVDFSKMNLDSVDDNDDSAVNSIEATKTWSPLQTKRKMNKVQIVTTSQYTIDVADIYKKLPKTVVRGQILPGNKETETDRDDTDNMTIREQIVYWCIFHATNICQTQSITEFVGSIDSNRRKSALKMFSNFIESDEQEATRGILIVPGLGDFQRYGIVPLFIDTNAGDDEDDEFLYLSLTVAAGAHFDGQIHITIHPEFERSPEASPILPTKFIVRASIIVPTKGKAPSSKIAQRITSEIVQSIAQSIHIRVQQSMVRSKQSNSYSQQASKRAQDRRKNRTSLERQMEEMAIDRRRKWQRKNPSGTSNYRPSGERMRNPNSAVSFR